LNALRRLGRTRRGRRDEPDSLPPFVVDRCECVRDGSFALLRVTGSGTTRPVALVVEGDRPQAFEPLPDPRAGGGSWRAGFALPTELAEPGQRVSLHDGVAYRVELTVPGEPARVEEEPAPAGEPHDPVPADPAARVAARAEDSRARKLVEAWSEANQLREKLKEREQELAEALQELLVLRTGERPQRDRADAAEGELATVREELDGSREEAAALKRELKAARAELETSAGRLAAERSAREEETTALRSAADELRAELDKLKDASSRRRGLRRRATDVPGGDDAVVGSLRDHVDRLAEEVRQQESCADDLRALLDSEREQVARARQEAEGLKRQIAAGAGRAAPVPPATPDGDERPKPKPAADAPPWSAVDDELLARIEKAKSLSNSP
jgi:predicted  nucleic acid-binding Zn-ribbon protein